jgi:hypothetical protein
VADILHPLLCLTNKEEKRAEITGRLEPIVFKLGPLSEQPGPLFGQKYADVTEKEGRQLVRRAPGLFKWPEGTILGPQMVSRDEFDALRDRMEALEATIAEWRELLAVDKIAPTAADPAPAKGKAKAKATEPADPAPATPEAS